MEVEEQHPIPQQISAYQFRLVGDMTLKQFFQVAAGALIALLIYSSNLPTYVKWPLILFSFLSGIALAFFPLEDRPLSKWIVLFIKAIYSPTIYVWKHFPTKFQYFQPEPELPTLTLPPSAVQIPKTLVQAKKGGEVTSEYAKLEKGEEEFLTKVTQHFTSAPLLTLKTKAEVEAKKVVKPQVIIPKETSIKVEHTDKPVITQGSSTQIFSQTGYEVTPLSGKKSVNIQSAKFSQEAAPPIPPTKPNIIVGQVVDTEGKIIENAILEIKDSEGRPVRALKSNKLGHFMIVTPLTNGKYEIITEKDGFVFNPISIEVKGEILLPIAIWAKNKVNIDNQLLGKK